MLYYQKEKQTRKKYTISLLSVLDNQPSRIKMCNYMFPSPHPLHGNKYKPLRSLVCPVKDSIQILYNNIKTQKDHHLE
ncbi:hypothetical protein A4A49_13695 [Nicotiana attenuata]|uniref:Uncharacterized protein n=1 Tax=Nicotiana attenuata TaxID=49451 RepID=A0A314LER0_NICAT|nr:hypothetical protein A4A49_13695 [Nicotiana attenuata]